MSINSRVGDPVELVFELPSPAHLDRVGVVMRGDKPAHVDVATANDIGALRAIGTIDVAMPSTTESEATLSVGADARFVRFTIYHEAHAELRIQRLAAYGTAGVPQSGALSGTWISADAIRTADAVFAGVRGNVPDALPPKAKFDPRIAQERDGTLTAFECAERSDPWRAPVAQNVAQLGDERLQLAGHGNILVGRANRRYVFALRSNVSPACASASAGTGPTVLGLVRVVADTAPELDPAFFPGYRFERRMTPLLEATQLQHARFAVLDGNCTATTDLSPQQQHMLLQWIAAGHKLIIRDADMCPASDYSFLPYTFVTKAAGAGGARGERLALADPSSLGSGANDRAHFVDTNAYLAAKFQQIGDADVIQTEDPRWCGHLLTTTRLGESGWVHAYARYGHGLIIYDGLDRDDLRERIPEALRIVALEYAQPVEAELPCNARVASGLALYPSVVRALPAGKQTMLHVPMLLSYAGKPSTARDVDLTIAGDTTYRAAISPAHVRLRPGPGSPLLATVELRSGWSGSHAFTVTANAGPGQTAQASIRIDASIELAGAFESQRRVRIYGIHFNVDSAQIQAVSEATIAQIAHVLGAHRDWRMRVEGHTDSDGGAAYNKALSVRRARAVVNDLIARYHVDRARLTSAGVGLTHPVAPNTTEGGKALNRRVELVRL